MTKSNAPANKPEPLAILKDALTTYASHFVDMQERTDRSTGEIQLVNVLGFTQEKILNGLCYTLEFQGKQTKQTLDKAVAELRALTRSNRGDEISARNILSKGRFIEGVNFQIQHIAAAFKVATEVYADITGKPYLNSERRQAERSRQDQVAMSSALPEMQYASNLLASLGVKESPHAAQSMDRLDRDENKLPWAS